MPAMAAAPPALPVFPGFAWNAYPRWPMPAFMPGAPAAPPTQFQPRLQARPAAPAAAQQTSDNPKMMENLIVSMLLQPGALGWKVPVFPSTPWLPGFAGMVSRRSYMPFGPHWDAQVQARAAAAGESLIDVFALEPQTRDHPHYPPPHPLRFGFSSVYPEMVNKLNSPMSMAIANNL